MTAAQPAEVVVDNSGIYRREELHDQSSELSHIHLSLCLSSSFLFVSPAMPTPRNRNW